MLWIKWYDFTNWLLEWIDNFSKNQRFVFGTWLADQALDVMETLAAAIYTQQKAALLLTANLPIEKLWWLVRLTDRSLNPHS